MNAVKYVGIAAIAAAGLFAAQAFATATSCPTSPVAAAGQMQGSPVCIAPYGSDGSGTGLQTLLGPGTAPGSVFTATSPGIDPYTQQAQKGLWSSESSNGSTVTILLQIAGYANTDTFGIYDPNHPGTKLALLTDGKNGNQASLSIFADGGYSVNDPNNVQQTFSTTNEFGFYLTAGGNTFYSQPMLNETSSLYPHGTPHLVAYEGTKDNVLKPYGVSPTQRPGGSTAGDYIFAWEDLPFGSSDLDYNDFVVIVESVHPVPEPGVLGLFGLGLLVLAAGAGLRRRGAHAA